MDESPSLHGAIRDASDPMLITNRIAEEALRLIPRAHGSTVELLDGSDLTYVCCAGSMAGAAGTRLRVGASLSGLAMSTGSTLRSDDTATDPRVDGEAAHRVNSKSAICVPLRRGNEPVGVLSVISSSVAAFDEGDVAALTGLAEFITAAVTTSSELSRITNRLLSSDETETSSEIGKSAGMSKFVANVLHPGVADDVETAQRVDRVLSAREFTMVFQPIVGLGSDELVGAEALARFLPGPYRPPDVWFADAHRIGRGSKWNSQPSERRSRTGMRFLPVVTSR